MRHKSSLRVIEIISPDSKQYLTEKGLYWFIPIMNSNLIPVKLISVNTKRTSESMLSTQRCRKFREKLPRDSLQLDSSIFTSVLNQQQELLNWFCYGWYSISAQNTERKRKMSFKPDCCVLGEPLHLWHWEVGNKGAEVWMQIEKPGYNIL